MIKATILLVLGILLAVLCVVLIFRNLISQYKMNCSGKITILFVLVAAAALLSSLFASLGAIGLQETLQQLNSPSNLPKDDLERLIKSVPTMTNSTIRTLVIGYGFYIIDLISVIMIKRRMKATIEKNANSRWNLK